MPARIPSGPSATASTSLGPGNEVRMISETEATDFGVSDHCAPCSSKAEAAI